MIPAEAFVRSLTSRGITSFTGVPCSFFRAVIQQVAADPALRYVVVPNEGAALAVASGAYLAGRGAAVLIQNSGLGNLINPLTSLCMVYRLPALLFVSGRAYRVPDEPQHVVMGRAMRPMLDAIGVRSADLPMDAASCDVAVQEAMDWMAREKLPWVFFVRKGTFEPGAAPPPGPVTYALKRIEAIRVLAETLRGHEYVIATTGKPSRELFSVCDRDRNFYMQGSMGHAAALALGISLHQPRRKVVVLDGDGALLMHLGIASSIGHHRPRNLYHVVLDNESYESTGDQDTTSPTTDLCAVAKACGIKKS